MDHSGHDEKKAVFAASVGDALIEATLVVEKSISALAKLSVTGSGLYCSRNNETRINQPIVNDVSRYLKAKFDLTLFEDAVYRVFCAEGEFILLALVPGSNINALQGNDFMFTRVTISGRSCEALLLPYPDTWNLLKQHATSFVASVPPLAAPAAAPFMSPSPVSPPPPAPVPQVVVPESAPVVDQKSETIRARVDRKLLGEYVLKDSDRKSTDQYKEKLRVHLQKFGINLLDFYNVLVDEEKREYQPPFRPKLFVFKPEDWGCLELVHKENRWSNPIKKNADGNLEIELGRYEWINLMKAAETRNEAPLVLPSSSPSLPPSSSGSWFSFSFGSPVVLDAKQAALFEGQIEENFRLPYFNEAISGLSRVANSLTKFPVSPLRNRLIEKCQHYVARLTDVQTKLTVIHDKLEALRKAFTGNGGRNIQETLNRLQACQTELAELPESMLGKQILRYTNQLISIVIDFRKKKGAMPVLPPPAYSFVSVQELEEKKMAVLKKKYPQLVCPLSKAWLSKDAVIVSSGHTFNKAALAEHIRTKGAKCPVTGKKLRCNADGSVMMFVNYEIRKQAETASKESKVEQWECPITTESQNPRVVSTGQTYSEAGLLTFQTQGGKKVDGNNIAVDCEADGTTVIAFPDVQLEGLVQVLQREEASLAAAAAAGR